MGFTQSNKYNLINMTIDTSSRALHIREAVNADVMDIIAKGINSDVYELILKYRFASFGGFFAEINDPNKLLAFFVCRDSYDELVGWACCFRFHERLGYSGTAQFVMDVYKPASSAGLANYLYRSCKEECRNRGVHTLISFAHSGMKRLIAWHHDNNFEQCGGLDLSSAEKLHVFLRKIA
jgi:L-amino acid N-acyltransferase YncA